jgi:hypothetical protein
MKVVNRIVDLAADPRDDTVIGYDGIAKILLKRIAAGHRRSDRWTLDAQDANGTGTARGGVVGRRAVADARWRIRRRRSSLNRWEEPSRMSAPLPELFCGCIREKRWSILHRRTVVTGLPTRRSDHGVREALSGEQLRDVLH